jgi:site-specific recombinase XerC
MGEIPSLPLERQLVSIFAANREDAFETQRARACALIGVAQMIHEKFGLQKWANLGEKHVAHVISTWKSEDTGRRSLDCKLSHLRWLVRKIGKANLVPRSNAELGVEPGPRKTRAGKCISDEQLQTYLAALDDPRMRAAIKLGRYLGMRCREAMLFRPGCDFDGERVWLKRGTKGGRPRYLWLHNAKQREVIAEIRALVGGGDAALIPPEWPSYKKWATHCYRKFRAAGLGRKTDAIYHDMRRTYARDRMEYLMLHGRTREQAAALVARELGHSRTEILEWYLSDTGGDAAAA